MRALIITTTTKLRSTLIRRILIACVAAAVIYTSTSATVTQAEMPGGGVDVDITYIGALSTGPDQWFFDGIVEAQNMSEVTIVLNIPGVGTLRPDKYGYFYTNFAASSGVIVTVDASDSTSTDHEELTLDPYSL